MGAVLKDFGQQDWQDNKWITTYMVSCPRDQAPVVKSLLNQVHIEDLASSIGVRDELVNVGLILEQGRFDNEYFNERDGTSTYIIYSGKHMDPFDAKRLRGVPNAT
jgi:hypothetical protein